MGEKGNKNNKNNRNNTNNPHENKRTKKLIAGETVIKKQLLKDEDKEARYIAVYYGNTILPFVNGNESLAFDVYENILDEFLNSKEGQEYIIPTFEENIMAINEALKVSYERNQRLKANYDRIRQIDLDSQEAQKKLEEERLAKEEAAKQAEIEKEQRLLEQQQLINERINVCIAKMKISMAVSVSLITLVVILIFVIFSDKFGQLIRILIH